MVLNGDWQALYDQIRAFRKACGDAHIKTILGTGELATLTNVAKASLVCMLAGADFIKTSTGKEKVNANLQTSLAMIRMIRWFHEETGIEIGYKPAGGISSAKVALDYMALMKEELGTHWLQPHLFRFGASLAADRHRAPARTQPHRPLRRRLPHADGLVRKACEHEHLSLAVVLGGLTAPAFSQESTAIQRATCWYASESYSVAGSPQERA